MAAFDRIMSGIPQMDGCFDNIRLGDNVVWRVDELDQFKLFMEPYVKQGYCITQYLKTKRQKSLIRIC
ncbi:MAG: hypothetical protein J6Z05_03050 [Lachnospiraceae bacterium]|nr:hypothetical protein [Lachnospiraceae bacterium]